MMTHRERQLATIRRELTDRVSVDAIAIYDLDAIAGFLNIGKKEVADHLGLDGRLVVLEYDNEFRSPPSDERPVAWSTVLLDESRSTYGGDRTYPLADAKSVSDVEAYQWPDVDRFNYAKAAAVSRKYGDTYAVRGPFWVPLFCKACDLFGIEGAMVRMMAEPAVFEAALDRITEITIELSERFLDACGDSMPIYYTGDDFATQRGLMISPDTWRKFIKPRLARVFEVGKKRGKFIWFHSCGDITSVLPDLIDIGMDVWETVQLHTLPISAEELKRQYGKHIAFFGGVNGQKLPFAAPEEIGKETRRCIEILGEEGGYICGPDRTVNLDMPPENTVALFEAACAFRREGYTLEESS